MAFNKLSRRHSCCLIAVVLVLLVFSLCMNMIMYSSLRQRKPKFQDLLQRVMHVNNNTSTASHQDESVSVRTRLEAGDAVKSLTEGPLQKISPTDSNNFRKVKVLCWIMTSPTTLYAKARHVKETWGPRCDITLYMSSQDDPSFPAIGLPVQEGRNNLWNKTRNAFNYIYQKHFNDADWFMKADDDTYVIVENLRYFLGDKNSSTGVYYGHQFKMFSKEGYMSGGAGYVLSKEALRLFATKGSGLKECGRSQNQEDVSIGKCLTAVGVLPGDSRDSQKRARFLPFVLKNVFNGWLPKWYHSYKMYDVEKGPGCCSDYLITCHYVSPENMHLLDFLVYRLRSAQNDGQHVYRVGNKTVPI